MSIEHHCVGHIKVAEGIEEPPVVKKCRCRKVVSLKAATKKVKEGEASWVILKRVPETVHNPCVLCNGDEDVVGCPNCNDVGTTEATVYRDEYGTDIVLVGRPPADKDEKKRSSTLAAKTPRVATIEASHILRAYVSNEAQDIVAAVEGTRPGAWEIDDGFGDKRANGSPMVLKFINAERTSPRVAQAARQRIEEYGRLILDSQKFVGKERNPTITVEPEDDPETGTGRRFDYGRAI